MSKYKIFECTNPSCALGSSKTPGQFTGGITAEYRSLVTGQPVEVIEDLGEYGDGWCPNCGEQGNEVKDNG